MAERPMLSSYAEWIRRGQEWQKRDLRRLIVILANKFSELKFVNEDKEQRINLSYVFEE